VPGGHSDVSDNPREGQPKPSGHAKGAVIPVKGQYEETGHGLALLDALLQKLPAGHVTGIEIPALLQVTPERQRIGELLPVGQYEPTGQIIGELAPAAQKKPAGQDMQEVCPGIAKDPTGQGNTNQKPYAGQLLPDGQTEHVPLTLKVPGAHVIAIDRPGTGHPKPNGQGRAAIIPVAGQ